MAKLDILGRSFEIAPFRLGDLRKAAPHIDAINDLIRETGQSLQNVVAPVEHIVAIVSLGLRKLDETLTVEFLEEHLGFEDVAALSTAMRELLEESGLAPKGEVTAPSASPEEPEGASKDKSETPSAS